MNHANQLRRSVAKWLKGIAKEDIGAGKEPMRYGHSPVETVAGRYASLRIDVQMDNDRLLGMLDEAVLYQLIPWEPPTAPQAYLDRRYVCIEAPLPQAAQDPDVKLSELTNIRHGGRVIFLGRNEYGKAISIGIGDFIHLLVGGQTGSGKSYTMRSLAYQIANGNNRLVLLDGKHGEGLGILDGLPGQVGPLATGRAAIVNALGWINKEMEYRYSLVSERGGRAWSNGDNAPPHLFVFFDEFQQYREDSVVTDLIHALAAQARAARIHLIFGTQDPKVSMFGSDVGGATRAQFGMRIAHSVKSFQASKAIVGNNAPRADHLQMRGDAYIVGSSHSLCERVQIAYVPEDELTLATDSVPVLDRWPAYDSKSEGASVGRPRIHFSNRQLACAVYAARRGWGRDRLQGLLENKGVEIPGSEPADRLLEYGREIKDMMGRIE